VEKSTIEINMGSHLSHTAKIQKCMFCVLDVNSIIEVTLEYKSQHISDDKKNSLYSRKYGSLSQKHYRIAFSVRYMKCLRI